MKSVPRTAMKVTTVRFGADLWQVLEMEADYLGISVSQYIREAALARAAAAGCAMTERSSCWQALSGRSFVTSPTRPRSVRLR